MKRALDYYRSINMCTDTNDEVEDFNSLITTLQWVEGNKVEVLDTFMRDEILRKFLIVHSVFDVNARKSRQFIEQYMIRRLEVSDEMLYKAFNKKVVIPMELEIFDLEPVSILVSPYRIEYGCRKRLVSGESSGTNHITVTDLDWEDINNRAIDVSVFLSEFENIIL